MTRTALNQLFCRAQLPLAALTLSALTLGAYATPEPAKVSASGTLPFYFEANRGQQDNSYPFVAQGRLCDFFVAPGEAVLRLSQPDGSTAGSQQEPSLGSKPRTTRELHFQFVGFNPAARVSGRQELAAKANYFIGSSATEWRTGVSLFGQVRVEQVYPGVDMVYYGNEKRLEYDFVVAPGIDPDQIAIQFTGADRIQISSEGDLVFTLGSQEIRQPNPIIYQTIRGERKIVAGSYKLTDARTVKFQLGNYDRSQTLVIDPILSYATYFGGPNNDIAWAVKTDTEGNVYLAGETMGQLPTRTNTIISGSFKGANNNHGDAFVAKFDNSGTNLIYLVYVGGKGGDVAQDLAVDADGSAYITGYTESPDFPTNNAYQPKIGGALFADTGFNPTDAFVTKIGRYGTNLEYSTYLGGEWSDQGIAIAVDTNRYAYVAGYTTSTNFQTVNVPSTNAVYGGNGDAFVARFKPDGSSPTYLMYLGGTNVDLASGIAVNSATGDAYVTGYTSSTNFPVTADALQAHLAGGYDVFIAKIGINSSPTISNIKFATYWGGPRNNFGFRGRLDGSNSFYITGVTTNDYGFPTTASTINPGGLFRTDDSGSNWIQSSAGLPSVAVLTLALEQANPTNLYAGTWHGFSRSTDGGATWIHAATTNVTSVGLAPTIEVGMIGGIAIDSTSNHIYAGSALGEIFKSTNSGVSWVLINSNSLVQSVNALILSPLTNSVLYTATPGGVFKSSNFGTTWATVNTGLGGTTIRALAISQSSATNYILYAATDAGVYRSIHTLNNSGNWTGLNTGLTNLQVYALAINPLNASNIYCGTAGGVFRSTNSGANWAAFNAGLSTNSLRVRSLAIDPATPTTIYAGTTNGLFKFSATSNNWVAQTVGSAKVTISALVIPTNAPATVYAGALTTNYFGGKDAFVTKFNADWTLAYSAVFGGKADDEGWDLAVDDAGIAHLTGFTQSTNFPTRNAQQLLRTSNAGSVDAFIAELGSDGQTFNQATYLGGSGADFGFGVAVDAQGNTFIAGATASTDFLKLGRVQSNLNFLPFQSTLGGTNDAFLVKLVPGTSQPVLTISRTTNTNSIAVLSWPGYWNVFSLQFTTNIAAGSWEDITSGAVLTNGVFATFIPKGFNTNRAFFRLRVQ